MSVQPEEFVLIHGKKTYDATKAHDYYMRTRKLKGRRHGSDKPVPKARKGPQTAQAKKLERLRKRAEQSRIRLAKRIERLQGQIEGKYPIPVGANPALRKLIMGLRSKTGGMIREKGAHEREKIATDLKAAVNKAREQYKAKTRAKSSSKGKSKDSKDKPKVKTATKK